MMMGRWVAGLGVGALSLLVPMYMCKQFLPNRQARSLTVHS